MFLSVKCPVKVVPSLDQYSWPNAESHKAALSLFWTQQINASLALQLTNAWLNKRVIPNSGSLLFFLIKKIPSFSFLQSQQLLI